MCLFQVIILSMNEAFNHLIYNMSTVCDYSKEDNILIHKYTDYNYVNNN